MINIILQIRRNDPDARIQLQWDKLYINNEAYIFSEDTGAVEHEGEFQDMVRMIQNRK